jgi:hypothetical protein
MSSERGPRPTVSLNDTLRSDHTRKQGAAQTTGIARISAVVGLGRVGERADGTVCSVDAVKTGIGPYRKSRFFRFYEREVLPKSEGARRGKEAA